MGRGNSRPARHMFKSFNQAMTGSLRGWCLILFVVSAISVATVVFAARFYTAERVWSPGEFVGDRILGRPRLQTALRSCLAAHDPASLPQLQSTGTYRIDGWFLNEDHWSAVGRCMQHKGWMLMPVHLYSM